MSDVPLIPGAVFGLRIWRLGSDEEGEYVTGAWQRERWPPGGAWLHATCGKGREHPSPGRTCACGVHAWHPRPASARRVLASRFAVPGIVEAAGAIELQDDGFRAERARPRAFVVTPGRNARMAARLAARYEAEVLHVTDAEALLALCRERGFGLDEHVVADLLGPDHYAALRRSRRRKLRRDAAGVAATIALGTASVVVGIAFANGPPSPHGVFGRTGWVVRPSCPKPGSPPRHHLPVRRHADIASVARETCAGNRRSTGHGGT